MEDRKLESMLQNTFRGDCTVLVRKLASALLLERRCTKAITENLIRQRQRVIELERKMKPTGRVLMVDAPAYDETLSAGDLIVFSDPIIDFCMVSVKVPWEDQMFDESLEAELKHQQQRFQMMPWELSPRYQSAWSRKPRQVPV